MWFREQDSHISYEAINNISSWQSPSKMAHTKKTSNWVFIQDTYTEIHFDPISSYFTCSLGSIWQNQSINKCTIGPIIAVRCHSVAPDSVWQIQYGRRALRHRRQDCQHFRSRENQRHGWHLNVNPFQLVLSARSGSLTTVVLSPTDKQPSTVTYGEYILYI